MNSTISATGSLSSSSGSSGPLSSSRVQIQGLSRQVGVGSSHVAQPSNVNTQAVRGRKAFPFTILELVVLAAGFGAFAALMTSCSSTRSHKTNEVATDSEPISTGLSSLLDAKSKQPKLNRPAEITKESDYQQLANQAKLDYEALFNRDPKAKKAAPREPATASGMNAAADRAAAINLSDLQSPTIENTKPSSVGTELVQTHAAPVGELPNPQESGVKFEPVVATPVPPNEHHAAAPVKSDPVPATVESKVVAPEIVLPVFKGSNALLASRVTGFGRYVPLPSRAGRGSYVFQSARSNRAIVYIEIENFGYRAAKESDPDKMPGDQWAVDLSTEMQLLDAYDGMLQVKEPERSVIETGRNKRRDFYLVQEIELPPTLTIGSYNLKIVLRDKSGAEPMRTETIIPVQIVADLTAVLDDR